MTIETKSVPRRMALPVAALAALLLAGCSTGHIGESWQCPLAEAGTCDSVAAADPAVPDPAAARATALAEPLWRVRTAETDAPATPPCAADCNGGFDPLAWLARLFTAGADDDDARLVGRSASAQAATALPPPDPAPGEAADAPAFPAALLPAEPGLPQDGAAEDDPVVDDLRTGEVVARIWIAPFVDANGVYREASHVRVVLEPAGWRLR